MTIELLKMLVGSWEGVSRTWFQPGELADESRVVARVDEIMDGRFIRHAYRGEIQGRSRAGEETIAYNSVTKRFQTAWIDDFHMNYAIMFSEGEATETGFFVIGEYDVDADSPPWSWKTVFELTVKRQLTITAYNISPDGVEAKAVETRYVPAQ